MVCYQYVYCKKVEMMDMVDAIVVVAVAADVAAVVVGLVVVLTDDYY